MRGVGHGYFAACLVTLAWRNNATRFDAQSGCNPNAVSVSV